MRGEVLALLAGVALVGCSPGPAANTPVETNVAPANMAPSNTTAPAADAAGPDAAAVTAFLNGLYAHYKAPATGTTWAPMDKNIREVFDADMVKLMAADEKALHGELGTIDGDWLCDCQDWGSLAATVTITSASATAAKATVDFHDTTIKDARKARDSFDLVKTASGWRIHDMGTSDQPSLRAVLTKEIADLKSGKATPDSD